MNDLWMLYATAAELRRYVNKRSVQAIRAHLGDALKARSAEEMANAVQRTVEARIF